MAPAKASHSRSPRVDTASFSIVLAFEVTYAFDHNKVAFGLPLELEIDSRIRGGKNVGLLASDSRTQLRGSYIVKYDPISKLN